MAAGRVVARLIATNGGRTVFHQTNVATPVPTAVTADPAALGAMLAEVTADEAVPGFALAFCHGAGPSQAVWVGRDAAGRELSPESLFPIASITKLATALAILRLCDAGAPALDDPLARHLPEAAAAVPGVTLRALLSHTAGLPPDLPDGAAPYRPGLAWRGLAEACLSVALERPPGTRVAYTNLGPGLLAVVVERLTGREFPAALAELVLGPLGIEGYLGSEPPRAPVVLTNIQSEHVGTELEPYNSAFWRALALPWGGLVTTPSGALGLVRAFAGSPPDFLDAATRAEATRDQTGGLAGGLFPPLLWDRAPWGLGVELRGEHEPHWTSASAGPGSFGHGGSSGCYAWFDPTRQLGWSLHSVRAMDIGLLLRVGPRVAAALIDRADRSAEPPSGKAPFTDS